MTAKNDDGVWAYRTLSGRLPTDLEMAGAPGSIRLLIETIVGAGEFKMRRPMQPNPASLPSQRSPGRYGMPLLQ
jgi:hypothetical protein